MRNINKRTMTFVLMVGVVFGLIACKKDTIAPPTVKVFEGAIILNYTNANVSAEVTDQGGAEVKSRGFIYGVSGGSFDTIFCGGGTGVYSTELNNLQPNTAYVYEAFAKNAGGIGMSGKVTFTTRELEMPTVKTSVVENISITTASCGGNVINNGGTDVTERGVCWSTNHAPTMNENHVAAGSGLGEYTCNMSNLSANTTYYVRAYAKNSKGIAYGEEKSFATLDYSLPEVTTANVTEITQTTAKGGGEVTSDGGKVVTERGICWSSNHNPTVDNHKIPLGDGIGGFTANISGLNAHTKYYVRAYAINSKGTAYGDEVSFTTSATLPTVSTGSVTNITNASATGNGNVTDDGGDAVTERGICWSTSHTPTISGNHNHSGTGTGSFSVSITGLSANTTYYVRAYAINSQGTAYGDEVNFKTDDINKPTVTTNSVTNITQTTATCGGNVTSDGGASVTARGVCWSTSQNPTVGGSHTTDGTGTGSFTSNITGLTAGQRYYVRAYATNSAGTSYGEQKTINTISVPTVTTDNVTDIREQSAWCGGNVTSDGGATVTERGICWSTSSNPTINSSHISSGSGTGSFTVQMTGLSAATTYYVRAYAKNSAGVAYGTQKSFKTGAWLEYVHECTSLWGLTDGGADEWAVRFPATTVNWYEGSITRVLAYCGMAGSYTLKIYKGGIDQPTTLMKSQSFSASSEGWQSIELSSPLALPYNTSLWVSICCTYSAGNHPCGAGEGVWDANARWQHVNGTWRDAYDYNGNTDLCWSISTLISSNAKGEEGMEIQLPLSPTIQGPKEPVKSVQKSKKSLQKAKLDK